MKKKNFVLLVLGVVGGMLFSIGLCMCLLPEWNAFQPGVVVTAIGLVVLLALLAVAMKGKKRSGKPINWKLVGKIAFGVAGALVMEPDAARHSGGHSGHRDAADAHPHVPGPEVISENIWSDSFGRKRIF